MTRRAREHGPTAGEGSQMAIRLEVDSRWLTLAGTALLGGGVMLGMMLAPPTAAPLPASPAASPMLSTELVAQLRRLADAGERRASVQPATGYS